MMMKMMMMMRTDPKFSNQITIYCITIYNYAKESNRELAEINKITHPVTHLAGTMNIFFKHNFCIKQHAHKK